MPKYLVPHKSPAHRVAAIALYRALLTQTAAVQLPAKDKHELLTLIRNRFRQARHLTSHPQVRLRFIAGYTAVDQLDNAVANPSTTNISPILSLLARVPTYIKTQPWISHAARRQAELAAERRSNREAARHIENARLNGNHILDRPQPKEALSGERHVPVMVNANGIPMLRIKKPQPHLLSQYIRGRLEARQKSLDQRAQHDENVKIARWEDFWDGILEERGVEMRERREPTWVKVLQDSIEDNYKAYEQDKKKNMAMVKMMQDVVDREQALYDKERTTTKNLEHGTVRNTSWEGKAKGKAKSKDTSVK